MTTLQLLSPRQGRECGYATQVTLVCFRATNWPKRSTFCGTTVPHIDTIEANQQRTNNNAHQQSSGNINKKIETHTHEPKQAKNATAAKKLNPSFLAVLPAKYNPPQMLLPEQTHFLKVIVVVKIKGRLKRGPRQHWNATKQNKQLNQISGSPIPQKKHTQTRTVTSPIFPPHLPITKPHLKSLLQLPVQSILLQRSLSSSPQEPLKPGPNAAPAAAAAAKAALDGTLDPSVAAVDKMDEDSETISSMSPSNTPAAAAY